MDDEIYTPSCYKPKCKTCIFKDDCERYKHEVVLGETVKKAM